MTHRLSRRQMIPLLAGGALALGLPPAHAAAACGGTVFTADEGAPGITAIDLATGRTSTTRLSVAPHNVEAAGGGRWLLAVGNAPTAHGAGHGPSAALLVVLEPVPGAAPRLVAEVPVGRHPAHVVADSTATRAFVTDSEADALQVVDLERRRVSATVQLGDYPHGLRLSPDGREAWVANVRDGTVSVVDVLQSKEVARIQVGPSPVQVAFLPDGSRAYVSLRGADAVAEIEVATQRVMRRIPVGRGPVQVFATPDGRLVYVANEGTRAAPGTGVSVVDVAAGAVIATTETGRGAHGVAICADGSRAFVTNIYDSTVAEIDVAAQRVTRRFRTGRTPNGITWIG
ncbi:YncE family protein [Falsiroseomonas bella]|nr:YncE family protein [Falsiroseomonas bella]